MNVGKPVGKNEEYAESDVCYFEVNAVFNREPVERQRVDCCEFAMSISVDLSVCLSVCLLAHVRIHTSELHRIFCACHLWPWLGLPPAALRYVIYANPVLRTTLGLCLHIMTTNRRRKKAYSILSDSTAHASVYSN